MGNLERSANQVEGTSNAVEMGKIGQRGEQRGSSNWEDIDPARIPDRREHVGEAEPLDERERAALESTSDEADSEGPDDPTDPHDVRAAAKGTEDNGPDPEHELERLHAFGNKERPRGPRLSDLGVDSWDAVLEGRDPPASPAEHVKGVSVLTDPDHPDVRLTGQVHRLPPGYQPPVESGLGIHADGREVGGNMPIGHKTIYPRERITAAELAQRFLALPWEYSHRSMKRESD